MGKAKSKTKHRRYAPAVDVRSLQPVPAEGLRSAAIDTGMPAPARAWLCRRQGLIVQEYADCGGCNGTPWAGTVRVGIKYTGARSPGEYFEGSQDQQLTWDDLQAIKDRFYAGRIALEIYPPRDQVVAAVNMRWLWVLPKGAQLPFSLLASSRSLMWS